MRNKCFALHTCLRFALFITCIFSFASQLAAQPITYYQFRKVPDSKMDEFVKRETTYWSKVAQKAVDKGHLQFWALLEKVSGGDMLNSPNVLFINTFADIDSAMNGSIWNAAPLFPGVPMTKIETNSLSTITETMLVRDSAWEQSAKAVPEKDFNYVTINFNRTPNPDSLMALEYKYWRPFIKQSMDAQQTKQVAWGNSMVLSPIGPSARAACLSVDLFPSLKAALMPSWSADAKFPTDGLTQIGKLITSRETEIYRVVKVVTKMN